MNHMILEDTVWAHYQWSQTVNQTGFLHPLIYNSFPKHSILSDFVIYKSSLREFANCNSFSVQQIEKLKMQQSWYTAEGKMCLLTNIVRKQSSDQQWYQAEKTLRSIGHCDLLIGTIRRASRHTERQTLNVLSKKVDLLKALLFCYSRRSVTSFLRVYIPRTEATSSREIVVFSVDIG